MNKSHGERKNWVNMCLVLFLYLFYPFLCLGACWYLHQTCTSNIDDIRIVEIVCIYAFKLFCLTKFILRHTWKLSNIQQKVKKNLEIRRKNMVKKTGKIGDLVSRLLTSCRQSDDPSTKPAITGISWGYSGNAQTWWLSKWIFLWPELFFDTAEMVWIHLDRMMFELILIEKPLARCWALRSSIPWATQGQPRHWISVFLWQFMPIVVYPSWTLAWELFTSGNDQVIVVAWDCKFQDLYDNGTYSDTPVLSALVYEATGSTTHTCPTDFRWIRWPQLRKQGDNMTQPILITQPFTQKTCQCV